MKIILTTSLIKLKQKSFGRLLINESFMKKHKLYIMVLGVDPKFEVIMEYLDKIPVDIEVYLDIDLNEYCDYPGFDDFIGKYNFHTLLDFSIESDDDLGDNFIFAYNKSCSFADVLPGLKDDLLIARRLVNGVAIAKDQTSDNFIELKNSRYYVPTTDDILAEDWVDDNLTLYPTTLYMDSDFNTCKMYFNLYESKANLPLSNLFYTITGHKNYSTSDGYKKTLYISKFKDDFIIMSNILNKIIEINNDRCKESTIEVFDPMQDVVNSYHFNIKHIDDHYGVSNYTSILINTDNYSEEEIKVLLDAHVTKDTEYCLFSYRELFN